MTTDYFTLLNYATQLTGDRYQAKKIVDYVILEGAWKLEQGLAKKDVEAFIVAEIRRLCYEWVEKQKT